MARVFPQAAEPAEPTPPPPWAALGDADTFRTRMHDAGFAQAHVVELRHVWVFDDLDTYVATMPRVAPPAVAMFETISPEQRTTFARAVIGDFRARQAGGPYAVTHEALIAVGTKGA